MRPTASFTALARRICSAGCKHRRRRARAGPNGHRPRAARHRLLLPQPRRLPPLPPPPRLRPPRPPSGPPPLLVPRLRPPVRELRCRLPRKPHRELRCLRAARAHRYPQAPKEHRCPQAAKARPHRPALKVLRSRRAHPWRQAAKGRPQPRSRRCRPHQLPDNCDGRYEWLDHQAYNSSKVGPPGPDWTSLTTNRASSVHATVGRPSWRPQKSTPLVFSGVALRRHGPGD
jgi:hypothetical protein